MSIIKTKISKSLSIYLLSFAVAGSCFGQAIYQRGFLPKEKSLKSIELQDGYSLELVLSEPYVEEPVMVAWDGNGAMYVVQMNTYMQDADATGEKNPSSRITRHVDSNGDGTYDQHSIYIDNLVLPRFVLPLDDRIMVGVTDTLDLWNYRDTTGDGIANEKVKVYEGGRRGGNMEHQPSGLMWALDNWLYLTYEAKRYRFTNGTVEVENLIRGDGQWGLTQDDWGRLYFSSAGSETPASNFQQPFIYGPMKLDGQEEDGFRSVYPIATIPDVQGGPKRVGENGGLNSFTGVGGQSIYRGDRLPEDLRGDLILPEPVGRLIRRAKVDRMYGKSVLRNAYPETEFIRTRDANFRPVWTATTPSGQIMIVDMHRGIIQQGNWTKRGSYLRKMIEKWDLDKNIGKGRIYRLVHKGYKAGPKPHMLDESTTELVPHLSHPNGWWRDTAQKLIILRDDRDSVVPALEQTVLSGQSEFGRLHALWTLEGIGQVDSSVLVAALNDQSSIVRTSAVRIAEPFMAIEDAAIISALSGPQPHDGEMVIQLINSITASGTTNTELLAVRSKLETDYSKSEVVQALLESQTALRAAAASAEANKKQGLLFAQSMERGKANYEQLCIACHGADGQGTPMAGRPGAKLAPHFTGSPRILGSGEDAVRILLNGMSGPLDGETYDGMMVPMGTNSDQYIADSITYVRNSFGNKAPMMSEAFVTAIRAKYSDRTKAWTQKELEKITPVSIPYKSNWKLRASNNERDIKLALDDNQKTRYTTGEPMTPSMWIELELPRKIQLTSIKLDTSSSSNDYPRGYQVQTSENGRTWSKPWEEGNGSALLEIALPSVETRFIRVTQTGADKRAYWSIHEITIMGRESF